MLAIWLAAGVLGKQAEAPPEVVPRRLGDDGGQLRRFWRAKQTEEIEERLAVLDRVASTARRRKVSPAQIEAAEAAVEWLTEARVAPIAVAGIETAIDALNAATSRRMAFAKALERHAETIRADQKRRKRNDEATLVLMLS
jgi:vacuolar-type H+-ATPase subunit I/STV1